MCALRAVYYRAVDGREPVRDFIDELAAETQVAIDNQGDHLNLPSDGQAVLASTSARRARPSASSSPSSPMKVGD